MDNYKVLVYALENYFNEKDWKKNFLYGGCYWFAEFLHQRIPGTYLMINRDIEHCALYLCGTVVDVQGIIPSKGFHRASEREISFMKKNYVPKFDVDALEEYLKQKTILPNVS